MISVILVDQRKKCRDATTEKVYESNEDIEINFLPED